MIRPNPVDGGLDQQARWPSLAELFEPTHHLRLVEPAAPTYLIEEVEPATDWYGEAHRRRGESLLAKIERAVATGARRREARLRRQLMAVIHQDRVAQVCAVARTCALRLEPVGWGELLTEDATYCPRRSPWRVTPLDGTNHDLLPVHARAVRDSWAAHGDPFDMYYVADEVPDVSDPALGVPRRPESYLVGAISRDGREADWFVLDRWELNRALV